jgi:peptide subunit release factor 1 (eRF1)
MSRTISGAEAASRFLAQMSKIESDKKNSTELATNLQKAFDAAVSIEDKDTRRAVLQALTAAQQNLAALKI